MMLSNKLEYPKRDTLTDIILKSPKNTDSYS